MKKFFRSIFTISILGLTISLILAKYMIGDYFDNFKITFFFLTSIFAFVRLIWWLVIPRSVYGNEKFICKLIGHTWITQKSETICRRCNVNFCNLYGHTIDSEGSRNICDKCGRDLCSLYGHTWDDTQSGKTCERCGKKRPFLHACPRCENEMEEVYEKRLVQVGESGEEKCKHNFYYVETRVWNEYQDTLVGWKCIKCGFSKKD